MNRKPKTNHYERSLVGRVIDYLELTKPSTIGALFITVAMYSLMSRGGCFDSPRTEQASSNKSRTTLKEVVEVVEKHNWGYNSATWINPTVKRTVEFADGTRTTLRYRTHAWQPLRRWVLGEEFRPEPVQTYEVDRHNNLVRLVDELSE